ncbi:MAG: flagellar biosynthesis anti-sigma factor FlgM [Polyangiales bacterium]|jgi:flagellar biosynthesis anti-sigma factor FlgM
MRINGIRSPQIDATTTAQRTAPRGGTGQATKVAVSSEARKLAEARAPAVADAAKIQRLLAAVARGDFMVDAEQVTNRMMAEER